jgi:hypothetical protein
MRLVMMLIEPNTMRPTMKIPKASIIGILESPEVREREVGGLGSDADAPSGNPTRIAAAVPPARTVRRDGVAPFQGRSLVTVNSLEACGPPSMRCNLPTRSAAAYPSTGGRFWI